MRSASARLLAAVAESHTIKTVVTIEDQGETIVGPLDVVSGRVTVDRSAAIRARADLTFLVDPADIPADASSPYTPTGYEARIERGVVFGDGTEELIQLGVYRFEMVDFMQRGLATVSGFDRSHAIEEARFTDVLSIPAGTALETAIQAVVEGYSIDDDEYIGDGVDGLTFDYDTTGATTPLVTVDGADDDRLALAHRLARDAGYEVYFDGTGAHVLRPEPDPASAPVVADLTDGTGGVVIDPQLHYDRRPAYNGVVATGENAAAGDTYRAMVVDDNPESPTYWYGRFGKKPRFYSSPLIGSDAQAESAAASILRRELGIVRSVRFLVVPNPAIEPGDVIALTAADLMIDAALHVIETQTIDLRADGPMAITTRTQQETL